MKCKNCGTEFEEGIFCPECGTKNDNTPQLSEENQELKRQEKEKIDKKQKEIERQAQEQERLRRECKEIEARAKDRKAKAEQEAAIAKRLEQENVRREMESRTVNGVIYKSFEEAEQARNEHKKIDLLKEKLLSTKSQKKRQEIFKEFNESIEIRETKYRYDLLSAKVNTEPPKSELICKIYGYTVLITFVVYMVDTMMIGNDISTVGLICALWGSFGCWIWPIWKIVQILKSKSTNHYKNIKKI